ncbi:MAG: acyl-CoA dehydrogenase family protein [Flavobacteriaceae bacterium]|nr:acyl-CoA dehydrogenase family protein [Flavobacteriaceae bacterium]
METTTKSDLKEFRSETKRWLEENCPASMRTPPKEFADLYWGGRNSTFSSEDQKNWFTKMLEKKWIVPYWDTQYGGGGLSPEENNILTQEMIRIGCRKPLFSFGISMLGPALHKFANEEQKMRFLPDITSGKTWWCQGYSEPNAGSDLAGLQTKAEGKGDHYLVSGSKVWTSYADKADWIFCLVRTDFEATKHNGISFLLIDMKSAGVSTRPIKLISGKSPFCETFFDGVKVPKENLIGTLNDGWTIAKYLLTHERQMIGGVGETDVRKAVHEIALENMPSRDGILSDSILRSEIAEIEMNDAIFEMTIQRITDEAKTGVNAGALSSFFKYYGTEQNVARMELISSITGTNGLLWESDNKDAVSVVRTFCRSKGNTIEGGTSEVQLGIISKRILNLPS